MSENPYESPKSSEQGDFAPKDAKRMNAPELFGVVVRSAGLGLMLMGFFNLLGSFFPAQGIDSSRYLRVALEWMATGAIPFLFANQIVRSAYRDADRHDR